MPPAPLPSLPKTQITRPQQPVVVPSPMVHVRRSWKALFDDEAYAEALARCWDSKDAMLPPVRLCPRALGGREVWVRHATTDAQVFDDTFVGLYHLPPTDLPATATIIDLGGNIGLTAAHFAALYPKARIVCVEMDPANAQLARRNLASFGPRCSVVEAAVWKNDGSLEYSGTEAWGLRVASLEGETPTSAGTITHVARAIAMATLLSEQHIQRVDYLKVDIEGAEAEVVTNEAAWLSRIDTLKLEYHEPATRQSMTGVLKNAGFSVSDDEKHSRCVIGVRQA